MAHRDTGLWKVTQQWDQIFNSRWIFLLTYSLPILSADIYFFEAEIDIILQETFILSLGPGLFRITQKDHVILQLTATWEMLSTSFEMIDLSGFFAIGTQAYLKKHTQTSKYWSNH